MDMKKMLMMKLSLQDVENNDNSDLNYEDEIDQAIL